VRKKKPILESKNATISEANSGATKIVEKARLELFDELTRIKGEIEIEAKRIYETLRSDVGRLSEEVAEKILKRSLQ
jgi:F0F1-type ATP synthase membrane subunit b/b'